MSDTDPYKSPNTAVESSTETFKHMATETPELSGLGGWLLLVGFGIIVSPFRMLVQVYPLYTEIFSNGSWEMLTTPGGEAYKPAFAPFLISEMTINGALVIGWFYIAYLFFSKKRAFPQWYIGVMVFTVIFIIGDALLTEALFNVSVFDPVTIKEIVQAIVGVAIWVPYMLVSRRVKATFVR